ncbi:spore germination protein YaaH [Halopolyspora algeriensis]|uniref:Spore germination protein YaaH n=1 Tax=Halopolyspora algeriensis TaxID=1500506 RepID=A0A368VRQ3_9ACTN|nr:glycosyl hydrolase family 18 protein [Halopolyspora algeriensis]RCW44421.1 spore germination protein YaaH [Halopolyspora algeriensis]TQM55782.1 spore germination protein YaaH [Halopolyspora algeriensis]
MGHDAVTTGLLAMFARRSRNGRKWRGADPARPSVFPGTRSSRDTHRNRHIEGLVYLVILLLCVLLLAMVSVSRTAPAPMPTGHWNLVVASVPFWNLDAGTSTLMEHRRAVNQVSPWMYGLGADGRIVPQFPPDQADDVARQLQTLRESGLPVLPTLANTTRGRWAYEPVAQLLHDPRRRQEHITDIVALVLQEDYAGIDIDYENLRAGDREEFTGFVTELAAALHARGKLLSVALFAKTTEAGYDQRNVAQDYAAIGRVADQVRLMGYDYHWPTSGPGPVAPIGWIEDVLRYAKTRIPAHKVVLGVPLYGYDWVNGYGTPVTWEEASRIAASHQVRVRFDPASSSPWFRYTDARGREHEVWFENAASSQAKFRVARQAGIGGVYLWMYGPADTGTWSELHETLLTDMR